MTNRPGIISNAEIREATQKGWEFWSATVQELDNGVAHQRYVAAGKIAEILKPREKTHEQYGSFMIPIKFWKAKVVVALTMHGGIKHAGHGPVIMIEPSHTQFDEPYIITEKQITEALNERRIDLENLPNEIHLRIMSEWNNNRRWIKLIIPVSRIEQ